MDIFVEWCIVEFMKRNITCPRCHKPFKTRQGLGNHLRYCKTVRERPAVQPSPPAPARARTSAEIPSPKGKRWDPTWSDGEKHRYLLESMPLTWGIGRSRGRWEVVPVPGGMSYSAAVVAADERNSIDRIMPPVRHVRAVKGEEDSEEALAVLLMLELMNR